MKFHFGGISKQPNILMDMCRHFISGSVYMIFYHTKWNFISVEMTDMKSIPALTFKRTCTINTISNKSALIHFVHGKLCSHDNLMLISNFILVKMTDMKSIYTILSFISPQFMWTQVKSWLATEVRFSTEMKSYTGLSWFHPSCEHTLKKIYSPWNHQKPLDFFNQICIVLRSKIWQPSRFKVLIRDTNQH